MTDLGLLNCCVLSVTSNNKVALRARHWRLDDLSPVAAADLGVLLIMATANLWLTGLLLWLLLVPFVVVVVVVVMVVMVVTLRLVAH